MIETRNTNLERIEKKIAKLTDRVFHVTGDARAELLQRIDRLKEKKQSYAQRMNAYNLNRAKLCVPADRLGALRAQSRQLARTP